MPPVGKLAPAEHHPLVILRLIGVYCIYYNIFIEEAVDGDTTCIDEYRVAEAVMVIWLNETQVRLKSVNTCNIHSYANRSLHILINAAFSNKLCCLIQVCRCIKWWWLLVAWYYGSYFTSMPGLKTTVRQVIPLFPTSIL